MRGTKRTREPVGTAALGSSGDISQMIENETTEEHFDDRPIELTFQEEVEAGDICHTPQPIANRVFGDFDSACQIYCVENKVGIV